MKRIIAILSILCIAFSFTACGKKDYSSLLKHEMMEGVTIGTDRATVDELYGERDSVGYYVYYDGTNPAKRCGVREANGAIQIKYSQDNKIKSILFMPFDHVADFKSIYQNNLETFTELYGEPEDLSDAIIMKGELRWNICNERGKPIYCVELVARAGIYTVETYLVTDK